jgi:hypothetical protein
MKQNTRPIRVSDAANLAGVSNREIYAAMRSGRLLWKRIGGEPVTSKEWINEWQHC